MQYTSNGPNSSPNDSRTWQKFQKSYLYTKPANRQYGAFLTFVLIFENSIVAAAAILDQISALHQVNKTGLFCIHV